MSRRYSESIKYLPVARLNLSSPATKESNLTAYYHSAVVHSNKFGIILAYFNHEIKVINYDKLSGVFYQDSDQELESDDVLSTMEVTKKFISLHLSVNEETVIVALENTIYLFEIGIFQQKVCFSFLCFALLEV